jgi:uncharacterized protein
MKAGAGRKHRGLSVVLTAGAWIVTSMAWAQQAPDAVSEKPQEYAATYARMLKAVEGIPIYDDHSHPGFADDPDVDAMASLPGTIPLRLRPDNPELIVASRELFGFPYADATPEHLEWLRKKKAELRQQQTGYQYFDGILDRLNVEQALANRVKLGSYLSPKRFHWVFFVDSVLFPFDNHVLEGRNGDEAILVPMQEKKLHRELEQEHLASLPPDLGGYLEFITRLLEDNQQHGGVAIKFEIGYFRSLHFGDPPREAAEAIYARYHSGGTPNEQEYADFQDYVFRYLLREAGRLRLPVHLHTAVGVGDFYNLTGSTALNLENVLRDARYEGTTFVLLHGGYPFEQQAIWLGARKNVYLDSSLIELYTYPAQFKNVLRSWLLLFPDKVVFGSDAFPFNDAVGAEESYWIAVRSARTALAAALAEMVGNHEVTEERALRFAHAYLHDNAAAIYAR